MLCFLIHARIACNAIQTALYELAAPGLKVQSARKICAKTLLLVSCSVTFLLVFLKACANAIRAKNIFQNSSDSFINLRSTKRSTEVFLRVSAKIKAPSTFKNVSIVILMLFCKIKLKEYDNNNYPTTALLIHLLYHSQSVQIGICNIGCDFSCSFIYRCFNLLNK